MECSTKHTRQIKINMKNPPGEVVQKRPPMENLSFGSHGLGLLNGLLTLFMSFIAIFANVEMIIRILAALVTIVSAFYAARYYREAWLEKKESRKQLKTNSPI